MPRARSLAIPRLRLSSCAQSRVAAPARLRHRKRLCARRLRAAILRQWRLIAPASSPESADSKRLWSKAKSPASPPQAAPRRILLTGATAAQQFARNLDAAFAPSPRTAQSPRCGLDRLPLRGRSLLGVESLAGGREAKLHTRCGMGPCQGRSAVRPPHSSSHGRAKASARPFCLPPCVPSQPNAKPMRAHRTLMRMPCAHAGQLLF